MGNTVARVEDDASCAAGGVEREDGLDGCVESGDVEGFEENLSGGVTIGAGVEWGFS